MVHFQNICKKVASQYVDAYHMIVKYRLEGQESQVGREQHKRLSKRSSTELETSVFVSIEWMCLPEKNDCRMEDSSTYEPLNGWQSVRNITFKLNTTQRFPTGRQGKSIETPKPLFLLQLIWRTHTRFPSQNCDTIFHFFL